jgi:hypothetical protein
MVKEGWGLAVDPMGFAEIISVIWVSLSGSPNADSGAPNTVYGVLPYTSLHLHTREAVYTI